MWICPEKLDVELSYAAFLKSNYKASYFLPARVLLAISSLSK
jgi:hypothetical protein